MRQTDFEHHFNALADMSIQQLRRVLKTAQDRLHQATARVEIEAKAGESPACPTCSGPAVRWGTITGLQRWRCRAAACRKTFNAAHGTGMRRIKFRDKFQAFAEDMTSSHPLACREAAKKYGVDKMTAWRWRMKICGAMAGIGSESFAGVVEADETFCRESRKGSREWAKHLKAPQLFAAPPRLQWKKYKEEEIPMKRGLSRWQIPVLTLIDRHGSRRADVLPGLGYKHIGPILHRYVNPDSILCSDKAHAYAKFAGKSKTRHERVAARRGQRVRDQTFHIQNVNSLHSRFKNFVHPFRGPASKYLEAYANWFVFREICRDDAPITLLRRVLATA
jgi:transposase-like protein